MQYVIPLVDGAYLESEVAQTGTRNNSNVHQIITAINGSPTTGKITIQGRTTGGRWTEIDYTLLSEVEPQKIKSTGQIDEYRFIVEGSPGTGSAIISDTELGESIQPYAFYGETNGMTPEEIGGAIELFSSFENTGAWTTATDYTINQLWSDGGNWYLVLEDYTSGASAAADIAGGTVAQYEPSGRTWQVYSIAQMEALTPLKEGQAVYLSSGGRSGTFHWDGSDLSTEVAADTLQGVYIAPSSDATGASGAWVRKLDGYVTPEMFGGYIQGAVNFGQTELIDGAYSISSPLEYKSDKNIKGTGKSFYGSVISPDGDFSALTSDGSQSVKMSFSDILISSGNVVTSPAISIDDVFLSDFYRVWIRNSTTGISITNSDSLNFYSLMVMEDSDGDAVIIGEGSRSIRFFSSNFEKNPSNSNPGGVVRIDSGNNSRVSDAYFYGCQFERGELIVENGKAVFDGGKFGASNVKLLEKSQFCIIDGKFEDSGEVIDIGFGNEVRNAYSRNMASAIHRWPDLVQASPSTTPTFGTAGEEYLFLVTAGSKSNSSVSSGVIEIKDGSTVLDTSPVFNLPAAGETIGLATRQLYTHVSAVKIPSSSAGPVFTSCAAFGIKGGLNLLTNGTFDSGTSTGWSTNSASSSASGDDVLITPSDTSWGIYQSISSICKHGKTYTVIARFNGNANLVFGNSWDGTPGARVLYSSGVDAPDGSGDQIAMMTFDYHAQRENVSLGKLGSDTSVTVKYIMMVEY